MPSVPNFSSSAPVLYPPTSAANNVPAFSSSYSSSAANNVPAFSSSPYMAPTPPSESSFPPPPQNVSETDMSSLLKLLSGFIVETKTYMAETNERLNQLSLSSTDQKKVEEPLFIPSFLSSPTLPAFPPSQSSKVQNPSAFEFQSSSVNQHFYHQNRQPPQLYSDPSPPSPPPSMIQPSSEFFQTNDDDDEILDFLQQDLSVSLQHLENLRASSSSLVLINYAKEKHDAALASYNNFVGQRRQIPPQPRFNSNPLPSSVPFLNPQPIALPPRHLSQLPSNNTSNSSLQHQTQPHPNLLYPPPPPVKQECLTPFNIRTTISPSPALH
jgi:hypothetical protein